MTDIALAASPILATTSVTAATPAAATPGAAVGAPATGDAAVDPFAALLASLTPATDADSATPAPATPPTPIAVALPTVIVAPKPALPTTATEEPILAEPERDDTGDAPTDDDKGDATKSEDPQLAMMLALAPPPPAPIAMPVAIVSPVTITTKPAATPVTAAAAIALIAASPATTSAAKAADGASAPIAGSQTADASSAEPTGEAEATVESLPATPRPSRFASLAARLLGGTVPTAAGAESVALPPQGPAPAEALDAAAQPVLADQPKPVAARPGVPDQVAVNQPTAQIAPASAVAPRVADLERPKEKQATLDTVAPLFTAQPAPNATAPADPGSATATLATAQAPDAAVTRELSVARDGQWLDTLARDIAATAGKDGQLSFRLDPHHLGSLTVHINHSAEGASVRLSADTEAGRAMLADAQPRLAAEARAQGLTLRETSVDLGGSGAGQSGQQGAASTFASLAQEQSQRQSGRDQTFINLVPAEADEPVRTSQTDARSDLYA
ncbi:flagellar hook-length control protein FliK [Sphingomonas sp. BIUV-7]|uniref:Flagellar hook-length control protein FliK n=1 Tax=Sphingomonas natans TaxID=3063330 RepID=A0ABT8YDV4_9SPHN|nr:flagellar hook-length control protein FliK [Sphingomonas sp. BIUV-7]MDO6416527.1 flagellar hook-length control protein FliK [Sphingomonas sp. BIUV-7]